MPYNPFIHHRRSIRLKGYDYSQKGLYFITICCQDRKHFFGEIIDGEMILNEFGRIAEEEWIHTEEVRKNCIVHEFIIMPNHIHGIIEIISNPSIENKSIGEFKSPSQTIGSIIRGYKIATIKKIKEKIKEIEGKGEDSKGELQFAPTSPTAPTSSQISYIQSLEYKIWQRDYYDIIIRDQKAYENISNYILKNPRKWKEDKFY